MKAPGGEEGTLEDWAAYSERKKVNRNINLQFPSFWRIQEVKSIYFSRLHICKASQSMEWKG